MADFREAFEQGNSLKKEKASDRNCVLAIDDDPDMRTLMEILIPIAGYDVFFEEEEEKILKRAQDISINKVILLDLNFGGKPLGLDLAKKMKSANPLEIIIFFSAHDKAYEMSEEELAENGGDFILKKPFDPSDLETVIKKAFLKREDLLTKAFNSNI